MRRTIDLAIIQSQLYRAMIFGRLNACRRKERNLLAFRMLFYTLNHLVKCTTNMSPLKGGQWTKKLDELLYNGRILPTGAFEFMFWYVGWLRWPYFCGSSWLKRGLVSWLSRWFVSFWVVRTGPPQSPSGRGLAVFARNLSGDPNDCVPEAK